ncbi:ABC transporter ATP-binding protein [Nibrella saemangeumensis]|uniref:ABC transporter ATP-binding protein n=1 Tax=Nibrella saemangeumensis TaxID=1084526 RepID=A0ABP8N2W4_9BACT
MKPIIEVRNLSKKYRVGERDRYLALRDVLSNPFRAVSKRVKQQWEDAEFWALKDITFDIYPGESIGIIGRNGAGKSTLLKILSKITPPTKGWITCRGRVASLLEVGTGFHPELTGRENIFLNGSILGLRKWEIEDQFDAIVDFSGVEYFLDTPLKRYSSGMQLRLAFAVAAHLEPEILVIDEVLAVGDAEFQKRCMGKMDEVSKSGRTVLFVSHNTGALRNLCAKSILLENGKIVSQDNTSIVIDKYLQNNLAKEALYESKITKSSDLFFKKITICDENGNRKGIFLHDEPIYISFNIGFNVSQEKHDYNIFLLVLSSDKSKVFAAESGVIRKENMIIRIEREFLVRGRYTIKAFIHKPQVVQIDIVDDVCTFEVVDNGSKLNVHGDYDYGKVFGKYTWL